MGARRGQRELARLVGQCRGLLADPTLTDGDYSIDLIMVGRKSANPVACLIFPMISPKRWQVLIITASGNVRPPERCSSVASYYLKPQQCFAVNFSALDQPSAQISSNSSHDLGQGSSIVSGLSIPRALLKEHQ